MTAHDPLCPLAHLSMLKSGCPQCRLLAVGRRAGIEEAVAAVDKGGRAAAQLEALLARYGDGDDAA
jgi:hypothetical protein